MLTRRRRQFRPLRGDWLKGRPFLLGLLAVGAGLRVFQYAADKSLWFDELLLARNILASMAHSIHSVIGFDRVAPLTLRVRFQDGTTQEIDFRPVLAGEVFGPLSESRILDQVRLDTESQTLIWPNGADFDPATLHDWPEEGPRLAALARSWAHVSR